MKKRRFKIHFNIGTVIFGVLFLYLIITVLLYVFKTHVKTYQVMSGPLSGNDTYTALIMRNESVVTSSNDGYITYFTGVSSKVSKNSLVCSVTPEETLRSNAAVSETDYSRLRQLASDAARRFDTVDFENVYDLQYSISNILWDSAAIDSAAGNFYMASEDGVVSTLIDGFEDISEDALTADLGQNSGYSAERLASHDSVRTGGDLYRLISGEEWSIYFPITDEQLIRLASLSSVKVKFLSDNNTESGKLSFLNIGEQRFGKITFDNGMIRYVDDRFVDVEIVSNTRTGLKIPVSSVVTKEFYTIPEDFLTYSGDDNEDAGFLKEVRKEDGTKTTEFVSASLYDKSEPSDDGESALYYVDKSVFDEGDVLVSPDSDSKYSVGEVGTLEGVYCVNRGYAVFRRIKIIDKNSVYCIVEEGTSYGLSLYDYIVEDGSQVDENQIVQ